VTFALLREENFLPEGAEGGFLKDVGGGIAAPLAGDGGFDSAEEVGEVAGTSVVFSRTGGTKGSDRPI
jgi:hypothetical protein